MPKYIQVPLGILDINENSTQGITEILRELYKRVPDVFSSQKIKVSTFKKYSESEADR